MLRTDGKFFYNFIICLFLTGIIYSCKTAEPTAVAPTAQQPQEEEPLFALDSIARIEIANSKNRDYRAERTKLHDIIHTKLEVSFDWEKQYLNGVATLELRPYFYPQSELILDARGFDLHKVVLLKGKMEIPLDYDYDGLDLLIKLDKTYTRNENYFIKIDYTAKPNELVTGGSEAITSDKGLYFINPLGLIPNKPKQIWTQGETEANSAWFPTIDAPNQRSTQEMYITVNNKYKTLSNGILVSSTLVNDSLRTDYWKMDKSHAPYLFMMAIGDYAVVDDEWNGLEVDYYVEPEFAPYAKAIFGNTPEMMTFFSEKLGYPFPWEKYAQVVVRDYVSGAMENTTASVFMEALQVDDRELLDSNWDDIIAHELFHQWFGDLVTSESWSNLPLNEAFATYSEYLWNEYKYGEDAAANTLMQEAESYFNEAQKKQVDLIRFYYDDKEDMFDSHSYAKGGTILHMLRKYVGDEAFFAALQLYLKKNEYQPVEVHHLRLAFEEVTGEDLNWFFNQWFMASGHPVLRIEDRYQDGKLTLQVWQQQDLSTTPLYRLPLYVDIYYPDKQKDRYAIVLDQAYQEFDFDVQQQPSLVIFDAEEQLLAKIDYSKTNEELRFQFLNATHYISRHQALEKLLERKEDPLNKEVFLKALEDKSYFIRRMALAAFEDYNGPDKNVIEKKIAEIAEKDKKSLVKADAMSILASLNTNAHRELFKKGLEDRSYAVLGAAIYGYTQTDATDKLQQVERFEAIKTSDVYLPMADYYILSNIPNKYNWFAEKVRNEEGGSLYYLLNYFGQYLAKQPKDVMAKGAKILEEYARNSELYYIRYSAFNALALLEELENHEALLKDIASKETDERLKAAYGNLFK